MAATDLFQTGWEAHDDMDRQNAIFDVSEDKFREQVLERSKNELVLVDFWADWCGPCRQLAPILEKLASRGAGRFVVARVDTDQNANLAASLRVQSIPTVLFFREGRVVDEVIGLVPESTIEQMIAKHAPSAAEPLAREAESAEAKGDLARSEALWLEALAQDPNNERLHVGLARVLLRTNRVALASERLRRVESGDPMASWQSGC